MLSHERDCVRRKISVEPCDFVHKNAVVEPADVAWLDDIDGYVIGGSGDFSVHHPKSQPWVKPLRAFLDGALTRALPGFCICFGHQLLGLHLGASVRTDPSSAELGTVTVQLTAEGEESALFAGLSSPLNVHSGHSDCVVDMPHGVTRLATNERCPNQAFKVDGLPVYSVQFHPDMTGTEARFRYLAYQAGFADKLAAKAEQVARTFQVDADESCALLTRFGDLVGRSR